MAVQSKGVATHHPGFDKYAPKWKRCRDVSDGQDAVHAAGTLYLPKLKGESDGTGGKDDNDYAARVKRSNFFNGTWRTLAILNGMLFRKPPTQDVPAGIEPYLADVDMAGASIETFARCLALEVLEVGRVGIMVDHPPQQVDDDGKVVPITQAVAEQHGVPSAHSDLPRRVHHQLEVSAHPQPHDAEHGRASGDGARARRRIRREGSHAIPRARSRRGRRIPRSHFPARQRQGRADRR
jgi:hypothetical protein